MQAPPGNPLLLPHTLQELLSKDSVQVELIPEKKGLFLKHVEYEVSSKVTWASIGFSEAVSSEDLCALAFGKVLSELLCGMMLLWVGWVDGVGFNVLAYTFLTSASAVWHGFLAEVWCTVS